MLFAMEIMINIFSYRNEYHTEIGYDMHLFDEGYSFLASNSIKSGTSNQLAVVDLICDLNSLSN